MRYASKPLHLAHAALRGRHKRGYPAAVSALFALLLSPGVLHTQGKPTTPAARAPVPEARTPTALAPKTYAIRNATIVPVVGERITGGTVVIRGDRILAVGANVEVPPGATPIDGTGLFVYPGMIDSGTQLGLTEISSVPGGIDVQEIGDFNPNNRTLTAVNSHSELIPVTRVNGVTTAITAASGGLVSGQAALVDLVGWTPTAMAIAPSVGMVITYPRVGGGFGPGGGGGFGGFGQQRSESEQRDAMDRQVRALRDYLADARAYAEVSDRIAKGDVGSRRTNLAMAAMTPVVRGTMPVIFNVETAAQIRGALALADSLKLKVILRGASEGWQLADTLAVRKIPVIVGPLTRTPDAGDPYDAVYANPGVLARAGVLIAFQSADDANARNLPYHAALATAYGLDPAEALRALTINPARIWGVADRYGSIEPGKVANLMVTTGDPLDVRSVVRALFIRGQLIPLDDKHTDLYERFRARPEP